MSQLGQKLIEIAKQNSTSVTEADMAAARDALIQGYETCGMTSYLRKTCDCDLGSMAGCKTTITRVALAIATARKSI